MMGDVRAAGAARAEGASARARLAAHLALASVALWAAASAVPIIGIGDAAAQEATRRFDIEAQPMASALIDFARQGGFELFMADARFEHVRSRAVRGAMTPAEALNGLLAGSGFEGSIEDGIVRVRTASVAQSDRPVVRRRALRVSQAVAESEDVVVVGTNIRGIYPSSSPVEMFSADEIASTGATRIEQFVGSLTQNFGTRTQYGPGSMPDVNREGVNGVDLRGLGVGTSLVLLNGRRLPLASEGQTADLSFIPLIAIDRVEVLTDGASAIYGTDAIGGIVNFVLRSDVDVTEARVDYGGVTDGDLRTGGAAFSIGRRWRFGDAFLAFEARQGTQLQRAERDYAQEGGRGDLSPDDVRYNLAGRFSLDVSERLAISGDLLAGRREVKAGFEYPEEFLFLSTTTDTENHLVGLGADYGLSDALNVSVSIAYSRNDNDIAGYQDFMGFQFPLNLDNVYSATNSEAKLEGRLWSLAGGHVRFSLGGGQLDERYWSQMTGNELGRVTDHVYSEVFAPLVDGEAGIPFARRLELSLAARYTNYEDESHPGLTLEFGDHISPKVGLLWAPTDWLSLRTSFSESFRAPSLKALDPGLSVGQLLELPLRGEPTTILALFGPRPLEPETARTHTFGFDLNPPSAPGLQVRATYFNIDYINRVSEPDQTLGRAVFADPDAFPDILFSTNSADLIEDMLTSPANFLNVTGIDLSDPAAAAAYLAALPNFAVYDNRLRNLAQVRLDGVDLNVDYMHYTPRGDLSAGVSLTYVSSYREQISANAPTDQLSDTVLHPPEIRGRAYVGFRGESFAARLGVNYVDEYRNPYRLTGPERVESWTTWDAHFEFSLGRGRDGASDTFLGLTIQNVSDAAPPFVATSGPQGEALRAPIGFDPTNAAPLGRVVSVQMSRRW